MKIFYRLSEASNIRARVKGTTKQNCLESFFKNFGLGPFDSMLLLADSVSDQVYDDLFLWTKDIDKIDIRRTKSGSEAGSFSMLLAEFEFARLSDHELVYFAEDDYIYLPDSNATLNEGLMMGDYATLRLHPDKFIPPAQGGNPLLDVKGGEATRIYEGIEHFWMLTNSTGMYPATSAKIMREDLDIWYWGVQERASKDFDIWLKLRDKGRTLAMPIPTAMSHTELESASSLIGTGLCCWEQALHGDCDCENKVYIYSAPADKETIQILKRFQGRD